MKERLVVMIPFLFAGVCCAQPAKAVRNPLTDTIPPRFIRYWNKPFQQGNVFGAYTSVTIRNGQLEFWHNVKTVGPEPDDQSRNVNALAVRRGVSMDKLGPDEIVLTMKDLINDVPRVDGKPGLGPQRAFTRTYITYDKDVGYVGLVCSHPGYIGHHYLHPAIITSKTGKAGTWRYLGKLRGEPAEEVARRRVWSDGGTIMRLPDGRWRIYTNGYGHRGGIVIMEADTLEGPWKFRRRNGKIHIMTPLLPGGGGGIFPNILRVSNNEWHLWISDRWMPDAVWHFYSTDGIKWKLYGRQPEIMRLEEEDYIKGMRSFVSPDGKHIVGLLSVSLKSKLLDSRHTPWRTHWSTIPVGPPPPVKRY